MSLLRLSIGCFLLSLPLVGCGSSVHGFDGEGGSGGTGQVVTGGGGGAKRALAMTESEFFALSSRTSVSGAVTATSGATTGGVTVGQGGGVDTTAVTGGGGLDYLYVFIDRSDQAVSTCGDPFAAAQVCDRDRDIAVVRIQPNHQAPGTYPIGDGDVVGYSLSGAGDCSINQGDVWETGTIEIISIDDESVRLRVVAGPNVPEVEIVAPRC